MKKRLGVLFFLVPFVVHGQYNSAAICRRDTATSMVTNYFSQQASKQIVFNKPGAFTFLTHVPGDLLQIAKAPFEKNNLMALGIVAASTAILLPFDQRITNSIGKTSQQMGLKPNAEYDNIVGVGVKTLVKWPDNLNSAFYQLGEGTPTLGLTGLLFIYGKVTKR